MRIPRNSKATINGYRVQIVDRVAADGEDLDVIRDDDAKVVYLPASATPQRMIKALAHALGSNSDR